MARSIWSGTAQPNPDLPRSNKAGQQAKLNHWRFCRLSAGAPSEPYSCDSYHAPMNPAPYRSRLVRRQLFYRHALGEIARFIDVAAEFDSQMIRQKLEWDDGEDWHHVIRRFRKHDYLVSDSF